MQVKSKVDDKPVRSLADERFDFDRTVPLQKSYLVASSYRSGSTYLCSLLWETGLLGAPSEVLNAATNDSRLLMGRFKVSSPADYVSKLLAHRTSGNGVFGMKAHFHHFEAFLEEYPALLDVLAPLTYIYIDRRDKLAQAVSMAKALQTNRWSSRGEKVSGQILQYDRELIANCVKEVEQQDARWLRWFDRQAVTPFQVTYEDFVADTAGTVRSIVELLEAQNDEPSEVHVPPAVKQSDETNQEWVARFLEETRRSGGGDKVDIGAGAQPSSPVAADASEPSTVEGHFFDRYDQLIKSLPEGQKAATDFIGIIRLRRRYDAIIARNRALFENARVLDLASAHGFWSLASLDAGAAHVVGVDPSQEVIGVANKTFRDYGVKLGSYRFVNTKIMAGMEKFTPEQFDVILCKGYFEHCKFIEFFRHLSRLRPKHVILDTKITTGEGPLARFGIAGKAWKGHGGKITSIPNHDLIAFLAEFSFRWRLIDWRELGLTDWTGIPDYARDSHRTYVLDLRA